MRNHSFAARLGRAMSFGLGAVVIVGAGCKSASTGEEYAHNPALRRITPPEGATPADADRAALARFVGAWNFEGWSSDQGSARVSATGRAAATIENQHFVLLDLETTGGELGGRAGRKSGSMLLASEPGIGATLTAWGDAAPSISRLVGRVEGNGAAFVFDEVKAPSGKHRHAMVITFQTDDKWSAEIRDVTAGERQVVARYEFTRVGP
jgi:hypothetical protein